MKRHDDEVLAGVLRRLIEHNRDDHGCAYITNDSGVAEFYLEGHEPLSPVERRLIEPLCEGEDAASSEPEVDRVARVLMAAWEKAEGKPVSASYVATFADLARAAIADADDGSSTGAEVTEWGLMFDCTANGCTEVHEHESEDVMHRGRARPDTERVNGHAVRVVSRTVVTSDWRAETTEVPPTAGTGLQVGLGE
jgi:hypothetical protein